MSFPVTLMWQVCFVKSLLWHKTSPTVDFPTRIPDCDDDQPNLLDLFICSNSDYCTVASHPPLGKSDHIVSVDVKFVVKSTNEHPYHRVLSTLQQDRLGCALA